MFEHMLRDQYRYTRVYVAGHQPQLFASLRSMVGWLKRIGINDTAMIRVEPVGFARETY